MTVMGDCDEVNTMGRLIGGRVGNCLMFRERGGVALIMLIGFIGLAVPLTIASVQTSAQFSRNSRVYDARLTGMYNGSAGVEVAIHEILTDPNFGVGLTLGSPSKPVTADANGETVNVTVTKVFAGGGVDGQGLVVSKAVMPTSTPVDTPTTFTYTITIKNQGMRTSEIESIRDLLPAGFVYSTNSTGGITSNEPSIDEGATNYRYRFLNDDAGVPEPWDWTQGSDQKQANIQPAQSVWTEIPEYWETAAWAADGTIPATSWEHYQWIKANDSSSQWRWKVQRVRGGTPTTLFTSTEDSINTSWIEKKLSYDPGDISIQSGDKLRLYLEVHAPGSTPGERLITYRWGGSDVASPAWNSRTGIPTLSPCGDGTDPQYELSWNISPRVQIQSQEELTLTFQADATLGDGTYYNQARARYRPSWDLINAINTSSPYEAEIAVGTGTPKCTHDGELVVTKVADVQEVEAGMETTINYTITFENVSPSKTMWLCDFNDWLPPGFAYVNGSSTGDIDRDPHALHWQVVEQRYQAHWQKEQWPENNSDHILSIGAGLSKSFTFQVLATLEQGIAYFNETDVMYSEESDCNNETGSQGGGGVTGSTRTKTVYDISAVAADGTVKARVQLSSLDGIVEIFSWQEY